MQGLHRRVEAMEQAYVPVAAAHARDLHAQATWAARRAKAEEAIGSLFTTTTGRALLGLVAALIAVILLTRDGWTPNQVTSLTTSTVQAWRCGANGLHPTDPEADAPHGDAPEPTDAPR